ncbi:MAG: hypothetical protein H6754_00870 [Candidatus Omnitrophica bacterium]|nr:hypothetical protein [Candidatus Omnitrophota bacterium]
MQLSVFKISFLITLGLLVGVSPTLAQIDSDSTIIIVDNYQSIVLQKDKPNYVKGQGNVKILLSQSATISFTIEKVNSPNVEFNKDSLPFLVFSNVSTLPKDASNSNVYGKNGDYSYTFTAPKIPGQYVVVFNEAQLNSQRIVDLAYQYQIIVVDQVEDKLAASKIADRAIFAKLTDVNISEWKIASQEIQLIDNNWDVVIEINYNSCGIDWQESQCIAKVARAHYLIDKNSGLVTEINPTLSILF